MSGWARGMVVACGERGRRRQRGGRVSIYERANGRLERTDGHIRDGWTGLGWAGLTDYEKKR